MYCLNCNKETSGKFCSSSCSASYNNRLRKRSSETKQKISETIKNNSIKYTKVFVCLDCKKFYQHKNAPSCPPKRCKSCNSLNKSKLMKSLANENEFGGHTSKRKEFFERKNGDIVYLQSSYEIKFASILEDLGIDWERPKHLVWTDLDGKMHRYYADFKVGDIYIDTKNDYLANVDRIKIDLVKQQNKVDVRIVTLDFITAEYIASLV